jgi:hypothetical protein
MNKKYVVHLNQGGGCDYTIGCGQRTITIWAENITQAHERFISMIGSFDDDDVDWTEDYGGWRCEYWFLATVTIYEVSDEVNVDMKAVYANLDEVEALRKRLAAEDAEKKEYERLQKKFG